MFRLRSLAPVILGLALLAPTLPAQATPAASPQVAAPVLTTAAAAPKDHSRDCANKARKAAPTHKYYKYWVCIGKDVKYFKKKKPGPSPAVAPKDSSKDGAFTGYGVPDAKGIAKAKLLSRARAGEPPPATTQDIFEDDSRCELVLRCTTIKTLYAANFKANAFYGYGDKVWGNFDVMLFQSFNGASSRYQLRLIWDQGYAIDMRYWYAAVRHNRKAAPDPTTGKVWLYPGRLASNRAFVTSPSGYPWEQTDEPTKFTGKHHDDFYGSFVANNQVFGTSTEHLPDFHCPKHQCKYYGPTGPVG